MEPLSEQHIRSVDEHSARRVMHLKGEGGTRVLYGSLRRGAAGQAQCAIHARLQHSGAVGEVAGCICRGLHATGQSPDRTSKSFGDFFFTWVGVPMNGCGSAQELMDALLERHVLPELPPSSCEVVSEES